MTDDLVTFIRARLDEDQQAARAACGTRGHCGPDDGEHWRWERSHYNDPLVDTPVDIEADATARNEFIGDGCEVGLRSIEEYPFLATLGSGPHLALSGTQEVEVGVGVHVARHDPARELRGVEAKRQLLDLIRPVTARQLRLRGVRPPHRRRNRAAPARLRMVRPPRPPARVDTVIHHNHPHLTYS